jgi:hypothetical protein
MILSLNGIISLNSINQLIFVMVKCRLFFRPSVRAISVCTRFTLNSAVIGLRSVLTR